MIGRGLRRNYCDVTSVLSRVPIYRIREAVRSDVPIILKYITDLALYEKEPKSVVKIGEKELLRDGFGDHKFYHCLMSDYVTATETVPVGYGLYFFTYSTWEGRVLYMEDIFIEPKHRSKGLATSIMKECAKVAVEKDCRRIQWQVLDWNRDAIKLYERWGGRALSEWFSYRMDRDTILKHASATEHQN